LVKLSVGIDPLGRCRMARIVALLAIPAPLEGALRVWNECDSAAC
jgi:hypothetical protein